MQQFLKSSFWDSEENESFGEIHFQQLPNSLQEQMGKGLILFKSSGSSGVKKYVIHDRQTMLSSANAINDFFEVSATEVFGLALPHYHVGGFGILARAYASQNSCETFPKQWNAHLFTQWVEEKKITITSLVPTQIYDLVENNLHAPQSLRVIIVGGGALSERLGEKARTLGWKVLQSYGMSEAASQIATAPLSSLRESFSTKQLTILPHWDCEKDGEGNLSIRGDALAKGLFLFEKKHWVYRAIRGRYNTSDRVELDNDKLTFLGRADRTVKIRGELVDLDYFESILSEFFGTTCVLLAKEEERAGNSLFLITEVELDQTEVNALLPKYAAVERFQTVNNIPKSALGKVDRSSLK